MYSFLCSRYVHGVHFSIVDVLLFANIKAAFEALHTHSFLFILYVYVHMYVCVYI